MRSSSTKAFRARFTTRCTAGLGSTTRTRSLNRASRRSTATPANSNKRLVRHHLSRALRHLRRTSSQNLKWISSNLRNKVFWSTFLSDCKIDANCSFIFWPLWSFIIIFVMLNNKQRKWDNFFFYNLFVLFCLLILFLRITQFKIEYIWVT